jgi:hypothetical protein
MDQWSIRNKKSLHMSEYLDELPARAMTCEIERVRVTTLCGKKSYLSR